MVSLYRLPEDLPTLHSAIKELVRGSCGWKSRGAVVGLSAGFIAAMAGSFVTIVSWFRDPVWRGLALHQAGTGLFLLVLPLLVFGAHCLDLLDKEKEVRHGHDLERD